MKRAQRQPEDDALDRLAYASREMPHAPIGRFAADVLAVREALERQREEVDLTGTRPLTDIEVANQQALLLRAESAEAEVRQLREERDFWKGTADCMAEEEIPKLVKRYRAEVRQLREERDALLNRKRSMSASPSDDDCEHEWVREHGSDGHWCVLCGAGPTDGGEPWESFASSQGGIFNGPHPADEEPDGGGAK